jgi:hypothetical protein
MRRMTLSIVIATILVAAGAPTHFGQQEETEAYIDPGSNSTESRMFPD